MRLFNVHISVICVIISTVSAAESEKRAPPLGFTGVRGKKSVNESPYTDASSEESQATMALDDGLGMDKRAPSGFFGMRGKKPYEEFAPLDYPMFYYKRAPSGFFGMRGKKEADDFDKRAPNGFMGMRGKKAPSGFFGMRGKKGYEEAILEEDKRAPPSGFFGMRGKKQPARSGFFGMRGKKYPYEFRGKFVGVRGKKMYDDFESSDFDSNLEDELTRHGQDLDLNQLMLLLTESNPQSHVENPGYYAQD